MYAMMITEENIDVVETLDPTITENPKYELVGNYLVFTKENHPRYIVQSDRFEEFFEIQQQDITVNFMKVRKK